MFKPTPHMPQKAHRQPASHPWKRGLTEKKKPVPRSSVEQVSIEPTKQTYTDEELGDIPFIDKRETIHSAKCRVSDIRLTNKYDRSTTARLKQDIVSDINEVKE